MKEFFENIGLEFKKITWPTNKELKLHTMQVFIFMIVLTLFFAAVDGIISVGIASATDNEDAYETEYDYDDTDLDELLEYDDGTEAATEEDGDED